MPRYKLTVEYDGGPFVGWQRQTNGPSVQQAIEEAIAAFSGEAVRLTVAGRTDAGVHALGQVAHCDLSRAWPADKLRDAINHFLQPAPVAICIVEPVAEDFDARFSAIRRHYRYRIVNRRARLALDAGHALHEPRALDAAAMHAAAQVLVGHHDFSSFRATECQAKSPVRTLDRLDVARADDAVVVTAQARSFLHHQVRNMVGTLLLVGRGKWRRDDVRAALDARDRSAAGPTAPAHGLYLVRVDYPHPATERPSASAGDST